MSACPHCESTDTTRHDIKRRTAKGIQQDIEFCVDIMHCWGCHKFFNDDSYEEIAPKGSRYSWDVIDAAIVIKDKQKGRHLELASRKLSKLCGYYIPMTTISDWWRKYD